MDSFYDAPRQPPIPTLINKIERNPVVPEISVVENSFFAQPKVLNRCDYNSDITRFRNSGNGLGFNKSRQSLVYGAEIDDHMSKKHVRFTNSSPFLTHDDYIHSANPNPGLSTMKENVPHNLQKSVPNLNGKTFKQIYMANVPNRHLDLSILEVPPKEIKTAEENFHYSDSLELRKPSDNYRNSFLNYSRPTIQAAPVQNEQVCSKQFENTLRSVENIHPLSLEKCTEIATPSDEPTIKDLFKIIQQQNEQIMLLQQQVHNLKTSIRQSEPEPVFFDKAQDYPNSPTKRSLFSIKATSYEVSLRPQHGKFRKQNDCLEPKIQEIVECDDSNENLAGDENQNTSLRLDESLNVKDGYVSAVPSIQINMDEYPDSDDDEGSVNIGITFYKKLMDQVNNMLKMQIQSECQMASNNQKTNEVTGQMMKAVKQATVQHLKSIGVNLSPIQESNEITGGNDANIQNYDQSEVSFAVKQLLMKYLPDDKLTQALNKPKEHPLGNVKNTKKIKPTGTEFSIATVQYLKKYNIIDNSCIKRPKVQEVVDNPKFLDVTALKYQPKYL